MPRNGSGVYTLPQAAFTPNTTISSAAVNSDLSDIASQLTNSLAADGQTTMTGSIKAVTGSAASPSYTFGANTNTGFYSSGVGSIGFASGGVAIGEFTASGVTNNNGVPVTVPVGAVVDFAGTVAPAGWYLCYGQSVATATYPALFAAIGYVYGGSGPNFNLPDCRGYASYGKDDMGGVAAGRITSFVATTLGNTGGAEYTSVSQSNLPNVNFSVTIPSGQGPHTHAFNNITGILSSGSSGLASGASAAAAVSLQTATLPQIGPGNWASSGGSDTAMTTLSNAIIFNKIIFAGA